MEKITCLLFSINKVLLMKIRLVGDVLWHINPHRLSIAKYCLYIYKLQNE